MSDTEFTMLISGQFGRYNLAIKKIWKVHNLGMLETFL